MPSSTPRRAASSVTVAVASQAAASSGSSKGSKARIAVARDSGSSGGGARGLGVARAAAPAGGPRRRGDRLQDEDALALVLAPRQVAAVGERQGAGEVELGESEEGAQGRASDA